MLCGTLLPPPPRNPSAAVYLPDLVTVTSVLPGGVRETDTLLPQADENTTQWMPQTIFNECALKRTDGDFA